MWTEHRTMCKSLRRPLLIVLIALLGACASQAPAPIEQKSGGAQPQRAAAAPLRQAPRSSAPAGGSYLVKRGDTLYSIAFRFGVDPRRLAEWNGLANPDRIYVGQSLRLAPTTSAAASAARPQSPLARSAPAPEPRADAPQPTSQSGKQQPAPAAAPSIAEVRPAETTVSAVAGSRSVSGIAWQWPASGKTRRAVAASGSEGLEILGTRGQPVHAAASGQVVYSGNGLRGYGELIIIKHSDTFLSAYAHNDKRLVNEGASVKAGQQIAQMGDSEASEVMVHFEIRKSGKAVSPLQFLPRR
jgi:lipoprotein NlpD